MVKDQYCVTNDQLQSMFFFLLWLRKEKKLPWQTGYKGLFSAAWDRSPHPFNFRQRGYTWINCAEQRLNYVGWRITQGSFCCPARTCSHPTLSCQQVFSSNSHSSKKRVTLLTRLLYFHTTFPLKHLSTNQKKKITIVQIFFGIFSALVHLEGAFSFPLHNYLLYSLWPHKRDSLLPVYWEPDSRHHWSSSDIFLQSYQGV